jgi:nicotinic acid mononucleotide adenylyltransferase
MPRISPFHDQHRLIRLRRLIRELNPEGPPRAVFLTKDEQSNPRRLGLLPGSFNPPTEAHLALARSALATGWIDRLDFLLASRTVNKERVEGATLADRLLLLELVAAPTEQLGVVFVNRGLYVDQAELIHAALPMLAELWFVVGFDKIVQIFDSRYYHDRDIALDRLFERASFMVAPRGEADVDDLTTLLDRPENRRYRGRISSLPLAPSYRQMSSSRVRAHVVDSLNDAPAVVRRFVRSTGAYGGLGRTESARQSERYRQRERLLEEAESASVIPAERR